MFGLILKGEEEKSLPRPKVSGASPECDAAHSAAAAAAASPGGGDTDGEMGGGGSGASLPAVAIQWAASSSATKLNKGRKMNKTTNTILTHLK